METQTVSFWTEGEGFTNLLKGFISEGNLVTLKNILVDGGITDNELIRDFILFKYRFEGDTRENDNLDLVADKGVTDISNHLFWIISNIADPFDFFNSDFKNENKDILIDLFGKNYLINKVDTLVLQKEGFYVCREPNKAYQFSDGVILQDGRFVKCGYQEHIGLYEVLFKLGLVETKRTLTSNKVFHISSYQLSGHLGNELENPDIYKETNITDEQLKTLFYFRHYIEGRYGSFETETTTELLITYVNGKCNKGGKFNNLTFLKKFYSDKVNLPKFSLEPLGIDNQCIRTSPKYSLPGLLNSKFTIDENSIKEIEQDWEKYKDVVDRNELNYFYQEYIEGLNGVAHYIDYDDFTFDVSKTQSDVVKGVKGNTKLNSEQESELKKVCGELFKDLNKPIQVEFVFNQDKLYIVQLRVLKNNPDTNPIVIHDFKNDENLICEGIGFSKGIFEGNLKDVLVIDSEADSEAVLNAKAVIVRENVSFSHALALSKTLHIPSIYGVGDVTLPENILINVISKKGFIMDLPDSE